MIVDLPFVYENIWLPPGARRYVASALKGYVPVDLAELSSNQCREAFEIEFAESIERKRRAARITYLSYGNDLLVRLRSSRGSVAAPDFAIQVALPPTAWIERPRQRSAGSPDWSADDYPSVPGSDAVSSRRSALHWNTEADEIAMMGWRARPKVRSTDENECRLRAAVHLSTAILLVDGIVHIRVREPAWRVLPAKGPVVGALLVEREAARADAADLFRLDRKASARHWAESRGIKLGFEDALTCQAPEHAFARDDQAEIARELAVGVPYVDLQDVGSPESCEFREILQPTAPWPPSAHDRAGLVEWAQKFSNARDLDLNGDRAWHGLLRRWRFEVLEKDIEALEL